MKRRLLLFLFLAIFCSSLFIDQRVHAQTQIESSSNEKATDSYFYAINPNLLENKIGFSSRGGAYDVTISANQVKIDSYQNGETYYGEFENKPTEVIEVTYDLEEPREVQVNSRVEISLENDNHKDLIFYFFYNKHEGMSLAVWQAERPETIYEYRSFESFDVQTLDKMTSSSNANYPQNKVDNPALGIEDPGVLWSRNTVLNLMVNRGDSVTMEEADSYLSQIEAKTISTQIVKDINDYLEEGLVDSDTAYQMQDYLRGLLKHIQSKPKR